MFLIDDVFGFMGVRKCRVLNALSKPILFLNFPFVWVHWSCRGLGEKDNIPSFCMESHL